MSYIVPGMRDVKCSYEIYLIECATLFTKYDIIVAECPRRTATTERRTLTNAGDEFVAKFNLLTAPRVTIMAFLIA